VRLSKGGVVEAVAVDIVSGDERLYIWPQNCTCNNRRNGVLDVVAIYFG
jgi:hypothetical protein